MLPCKTETDVLDHQAWRMKSSMLAGEDGRGHLQYRQCLLSLQAFLVSLFLPAEMQQRKDADNVINAENAESCPF